MVKLILKQKSLKKSITTYSTGQIIELNIRSRQIQLRYLGLYYMLNVIAVYNLLATTPKSKHF